MPQKAEPLMEPSEMTLTKLEIAEHQLDRALQLFLDESDYVSALTLAGASEEILGKLLESAGQTHSLAEFVGACVRTGKIVFNELWPAKDFADMANHFRNGLKHLTDGQAMTIPREAAVEMLDRAIDNLWRITGRETPRMRKFMEKAHGA
jgi:hypothetical protein